MAKTYVRTPTFYMGGGRRPSSPPTLYASAYSIPRFTTFMYHIGGRDDFLPSPPLLLRHSVNQFVSRLVLRLNVAEIFALVFYIIIYFLIGHLDRERIWPTSSWYASSRS